MQFNPIYDRVPRGAVEEGKEVSLSLSLSFLPKKVKVLFKKDGQDGYVAYGMKQNGDKYVFSNTFEKGIMWYHFEVEYENKILLFGARDDFYAEEQKNVKDYALVVTEEQENIASMGIVYHIFVDRFCKKGKVVPRKCFTHRKDWGGNLTALTNDPVELNKEVFCGNLQGVTEKLSYLKTLGVETIYLSPIMLSNSYHKYDTASYFDVDPMFGGDTAFKTLVEKAKAMGIGVLIDGVYNHTGSDSIYFNKEQNFEEIGAYNLKTSKYYDWYRFSNWPNEYDCWWNVPSLPAINSSSSFADFIAGEGGVLEKWLSYGIRGVRLDVVDELKDDFIDKITARVRAHGKDKVVIGEVWEDAATKLAYGERRKYFACNQLDSVMNYPLKNGILSYITTRSETEYVKNVFMLLDHYPKKALFHLLNIIGTHDSKRVCSVIEEVTADKKQALILQKIATLLQFGFVGSPTIFYGDERSVLGGEAPLCRVCFPWKKTNTESEKWYKFLGELCQNKVMREGDYELLYAKNGVIVFKRFLADEEIVIATNLSIAPYYLQISNACDILSGKMIDKGLGVKPNDFVILHKQGEKHD